MALACTLEPKRKVHRRSCQPGTTIRPVRRLLQAAFEPLAGTQEFLRIDGMAAYPRLVMQVRSGGASGRADPADDLARLDGLADVDVDARKVPVARRQPV